MCMGNKNMMKQKFLNKSLYANKDNNDAKFNLKVIKIN